MPDSGQQTADSRSGVIPSAVEGSPAGGGWLDFARHDTSRRLLSAVCCLASFVILAVALTWPLATQLDTAVADLGDPLLNAWIIDWVAHALTHAPLHLFDAPAFYPAKYPLAFSEHMTGIALLVIPFHLAGASAIALHNIAIILSFALAGFGAFVLARVVTRDRAASLVAGIFYAFVSYKFDHLSHLQIVASGWIPLTLAGLILFHRTGSRRHAALFAAAFVMNGLSNVYWLVFTGFAVAMTILFLEIVSTPFDRKRLAIALGAALLVLLPFLVPYRVVSQLYNIRRTSIESLGGSASWPDWFAASPRSLLYGHLGTPRAERTLFPGILPIVLAIAAFWPLRFAVPRPKRKVLAIVAMVAAITGCALLPWHRSDVPFTLAVAFALASLPVKKFADPDRWVAVVWVAIGFIGSFGEHSFLHPFLFRLFEPFRATRTPARWAIIFYCGLAILAAIGASRFKRARYALVLLAVIEVIPRIAWDHVQPGFPPVYQWLASAKPMCAIELPMGNQYEIKYILASSVHRVPLMNGVLGFDPPVHEALWKHAYDDTMLGLIAKYGATVIVHPDAAKGVQPWIDRGELREVIRFADGDAVFVAGQQLHPSSALRAPSPQAGRRATTHDARVRYPSPREGGESGAKGNDSRCTSALPPRPAKAGRGWPTAG